MSIHLKQRADGTNNWTFPNFDDKPGTASSKPSDQDALPEHISGIDIRKIELRDLSVEFRGVNDKPVLFALNKFDASLPLDGPLRATAEGSVDRMVIGWIQLSYSTPSTM